MQASYNLAYFLRLAALIALALVGLLLAKQTLIASWGLNPLILALLLGLILGNSLKTSWLVNFTPQLNLAKGPVLRLGVVLYAFKISLVEVLGLGSQLVVIAVVMVVATLVVSYLITVKLLKLHPTTGLLIAAGCSICGAAAILASAPLLKAKNHQLTPALGVIVIFGSLALLVYPLMFTYLTPNLTLAQQGVLVGASVHEVAQVVALGQQLGEEANQLAVVTKMLRVCLLAPFVLVLSWYLSHQQAVVNQTKTRVKLPSFALIFLLVLGMNALITLPEAGLAAVIALDDFLLSLAMLALGLTTRLSSLKQAGSKPFLAGLAIFIWLIAAGWALVASLS